MTTTLNEFLTTARASDLELVDASRHGNRDAFGWIVQRYQGMVTGLIYASCGDLQRSEDLAQETFISAWKSLSGLREPAKLASWLCRIARHRVLDQNRSASRENARVARALGERETPNPPRPEQEMLSAEERDLLWRTLAEIPQPYRETMVLYYRQEQSAADVAVAMETTEAAVRQRLSRGREMLREQVAAVLERNLTRSAPSPAFAVAVIAALPATIPATVKAATAGAAIKGAAAGGSAAGLLTFLSVIIGPAMGVIAGILGTREGLKIAQSPRERRFIIRSAVLLGAIALIAMAGLFSLIHFIQLQHWSPQTGIIIQSLFWVVYGGIILWYIVGKNRRHRALRKSEGFTADPPAATGPGRNIRTMMIMMATFGALAWMAGFALEAGDYLSVGIVLAAIVLINMAAAHYIRTRHAPERAAPIYAFVLGLITVIMMNWRGYGWLAAVDGSSIEHMQARIPRWGLNLLIGAIFLTIEVMTIVPLWLNEAANRQPIPPP